MPSLTQTAQRLLLVDDEPQIVRALTPALQAAGYEVTSAETGNDALTQLALEPCDLLILDLGLPDMDGTEVIARVRKWDQAPIIVLSARGVESEKIAALDAGADDFVNKPAGIGELLARIRANLRGRERSWDSQARVRAGDLEIDFGRRRVSILDAEIKLTPREYELLRILARHRGRVVSHRQVIAAIWAADANVDAQTVRVLVAQLRQKIEADPCSPTIVLTEPGLGYRLASAD